jgi:CRP/FNR family cyclic AMP-dependent transcriptional regulator
VPRRAPGTYWFGVVDGLLKMSNDSADGRPITFTGLPPGGWFGEGTLLKREVYRYNIEALRKSVVAGLPIDTFHWLLDRSIPFNRFVMNQLNERLGQFIAAREIDRLNDPDAAWRAAWRRCSTRCCTPAWARCCASPSRSWATWWACRASG